MHSAARQSRNPLTIALIYDQHSPEQALNLPPTPPNSNGSHSDHDDDHGISGVSDTLQAAGHTVIEIDGIRALVAHLASGNYQNWDLALNIAEGMHGLAREAQVPCLLEAYDIPFTFADAATTALCLDKGRTKIFLSHHLIPTAPFAIIPPPSVSCPTHTPATLHHHLSFSSHFPALQTYPLFAKPLGEGTSKGILPCSKIRHPDDLLAAINALSKVYAGQDILLERFLSGREITVGIVGTGEEARAVGANEYVYKAKPKVRLGSNGLNGSVGKGEGSESARVKGEVGNEMEEGEKEEAWMDFASDAIKNAPMDEHARMDVVTADMSADVQVKEACQTALKAWMALGCRDAGRVDLRIDVMGEEGVANVLEVNPIPGIIPDWSDLSLIAVNNGLSYGDFLEEVVMSAVRRGRGSRRESDGMALAANGKGEGMNGGPAGKVDEPTTTTRRERWEIYQLRT